MEKFECPHCGSIDIIGWGSDKRILKNSRGEKSEIRIKKRLCKNCGKVFRVYPNDILPYKHYERSVVEGDYGDGPDESTIRRWSRDNHIL